MFGDGHGDVASVLVSVAHTEMHCSAKFQTPPNAVDLL